MKHCLLADYDDNKIFSDVLLKLDFIDTLIDEHLGSQKDKDNSPKYLPRDPAAFRKYCAKIPVNQPAFT